MGGPVVVATITVSRTPLTRSLAADSTPDDTATVTAPAEDHES